jgi:hypothetical protein
LSALAECTCGNIHGYSATREIAWLSLSLVQCRNLFASVSSIP